MSVGVTWGPELVSVGVTWSPELVSVGVTWGPRLVALVGSIVACDRELVELELPIAVGVEFVNHGPQLLAAQRLAVGRVRQALELVGRDGAGAVRIEEVEGRTHPLLWGGMHMGLHMHMHMGMGMHMHMGMHMGMHMHMRAWACACGCAHVDVHMSICGRAHMHLPAPARLAAR